MRSVVTCAVVGIMGICLSACGNAGTEGSDGDDTITIGASVSRTGPLASSGEFLAQGYELGVDQINADGGIDGRKVKLKLYDDRSDPGTVARLYPRLLSQDKVDVLVSPFGTTLGQAAAQFAEKFKKPMVHAITSDADVFADTQYNVQGHPAATTLLQDVATVAKQSGYQRIALIANDQKSQLSICQGVEERAEAQGLEVVFSESYAPDTRDFSSLALKAKQADPEVVVTCEFIEDAISLTRALSQQGVEPKMHASVSVQEPTFGESLGNLSNGIVGYVAWSPELDTTGNQEYVSGFEESFSSDATYLSATGYAAIQVIRDAIAKAGSTDSEKLNQALHGSRAKTILGDYKVSPTGVQEGYSSVLVQRQAAGLPIVYPDDVATAKLKLPD